VPHFPAGSCACGADLAVAADLGVAASHQIADIPLETATVTQHDLHEVACRCGRVHRAPAPAGAGAAGTVTYGLGLQAWCVYLMAAHAIPVHRCAELIEALTGAEPSPGFVHSMIARAAAAVAEPDKAIRCLIILAHVISADETPIRAGPGPKTRKRYLLVACTNLLTYYFLGDRSMKTFNAFVLPDLSGTVVVHDRYQNYDAIPGDVAAPMIHAFKHGVLVGLSQIPRVPGRKQEPCRDLLECLRDRQDDVLRFTTDLRIPPTSNQAERDLRPAKTQQKISGRLRSEQVTRDRYAIRGYISTVAKHGVHVLTAIHDALAGNPWMPPIPDPP
jgi:transposase